MSSQEQPEHQQPDDQADGDASEDATPGAGGEEGHADASETGDEGADGESDAGPDGEDADEKKPPTEDERLEQVSERIDKARTRAEEAGVLVDEGEEKEFVESRATEEEDDQTIAPPG